MSTNNSAEESAMPPIEDLSDLASKVNAASDKAHQLLKSAEERLREMNLGVEAFAPRILARRTNHDYDERGYEEEDDLGWVKYVGEWQLVIRRQIYRTIEEDPELMSEKFIPVLEASRELRIAALESLEPLVAQMKEEGERILKIVEKASSIEI